MNLVDHLMILLLFVVQPSYSYLEGKRQADRAAAGEPLDRVRFYRQTALIEWLFLAALAAVWVVHERPASDLGFLQPGMTALLAGIALLIVLASYIVYSFRWARKAGESEKAKQISSIGDMVRYLPRNRRELHNFYGISVTAGIVEEIVYRGFVIWYLSQLMPVWYAVGTSSIAFGLAHSYQGASGALRCGLLGFAFAVLYVLTGSIWVPMLIHAFLDVAQGAALHELLRQHRCSLDLPNTDGEAAASD